MSNVPNDSLYSTSYWSGLMSCADMGDKTIEHITENCVRFRGDYGVYVISHEDLESQACH